MLGFASAVNTRPGCGLRVGFQFGTSPQASIVSHPSDLENPRPLLKLLIQRSSSDLLPSIPNFMVLARDPISGTSPPDSQTSGALWSPRL